MSNVVPIDTPGQLHAERLAGKSSAMMDVRTAAEYRAGHNLTHTQEKIP